MRDIHYDDGSAARLERAATTAARRLRAQAAARRTAAESAREDFDGAYAKRFDESARVESEDRAKLARVLDELTEQVHRATAAADQERTRRADLEAWQQRQQARDDDAAASPLGVFGTAGVRPLDIRPSETPVAPPEVSAAFAPRARTRTAGGTPEGRSAADPAALRGFAATTRGLDLAAGSDRTAVRSAWTAFTSACGWAHTGSASFVGGFDRLLDENAEDAAWLDRIADAFDRAGGQESLSNGVLDIAAAAELPAGMTALFAPGLTATQVAALWAELGLTAADRGDVKGLPLPVLRQLGNLDGVAYWARDAANRVVLDEDMRGYLDPDTESLYNIGQATTGHPEAMTKHETKGMTWYEKTVLQQMQQVP